MKNQIEVYKSIRKPIVKKGVAFTDRKKEKDKKFARKKVEKDFDK